MRMIFAGRVQDARFTNEQNDTIEITYEKDGVVHPYYISVDPVHPAYKALMAEGWDIEKIQKATIDFNRAQSRNFNNVIDGQITEYKKELRKEFQKELDRRVGELREAEVTKSQLFKTVIDNNTDEEVIFKVKLAIFDLPEIKSLKDRAGKMRLRKAKTLIQTLAIFEELLETTHNEPSGTVQHDSTDV